ncbi:VanZ like family protein [Lachnospiraceae bacterium NE2001]|nr:VanZ like family protein [Lachnospiraceae bacterium NE2001]
MEMINRLHLNKRKKVFWILSFIMMITIFVFSARDAEDSTRDSHKVGKTIGYIREYDFENWTADAQERYASRLDHPIRKTAHFLEYMTLGILLFGAIYDSPYDHVDEKKNDQDAENKGLMKLNVKNALIPWCITTLYAATDEFHQLFVSGRSGGPIDIIIDGTGALVGVGLAFLATKLFSRYLNS